MSSVTPNLGLIKPADIEHADIDDINNNMDIIDAAFLNKVYPIGSIYMSVNAVSPSSFLGGSWERITGSFLLAATDNGSSGAEQAAGNTGGAATVKLTSAQSGLPAHAHGLNSHTHTVGAHKHTVPQHGHGNTISFSVNSSGAVTNGITGGSHTHNLKFGTLGRQSGSNEYDIGQGSMKADETTMASTHTHNLPNHTHTLTKSGSVTDKAAFDTNNSTEFNSGAATGNTANNSAADASTAHENMPPYLSVYMWKRVA